MPLNHRYIGLLNCVDGRPGYNLAHIMSSKNILKNKRLLEFRCNILILCLLLATLLAACNDENGTPTQSTQEAPAAGETSPAAVSTENSAAPVESGNEQISQDPTPIPPTPTPSEPLAALVNGQPIFLVDYENELARYQQAEAELGTSETNYSQIVIDVLVERELIAQAAAANGVSVSEEEVNAQVAESLEASGGAENFAAWLQSNQLTEEEFRKAIMAGLLTQKMIEIITADVPTTVEQIHARYIRVDDEALAQTILDQINSGADFVELARQYSIDPSGQSGGDMGFFAAGTLFVPELEAPAFALQPGETSQVISAAHSDGSTTYYILQVIERDPQRALSDNQRNILLQDTIEAWIQGLRSEAEITIFVDTNAQ